MPNDDTLTSPPLRGLPRPRVRHALHVLFPHARTVTLPAGITTLGREGASVTFPEDRAMSRAHAELTLKEGGLHVRDIGSHNGTWLNGVRITHAIVRDGDVLRLGDTFFLYRIEPTELLDGHVPTLLGYSPAIRALRARLAEVAPTSATIVLLGETGTGKSLAARAIHTASGRRGELVHVNCAAIPESVAESTLFGHKAGAFTDARTDSPGMFRAAHRGTLFLDEVGLLSPATQARLLLALEQGVVTPVGSTIPVPVDVRIIAATNEDLLAGVEARTFRADLYGRLDGTILTLPPLRQRREDVLLLLRHALGPKAPPLTPDAVDLLLRWHWPFNVREVEKLAGELRIRAEGQPTLSADLLSERFLSRPTTDAAPPRAADNARAAERAPAGTPESAPAPARPADAATLARWLTEVDGNVTELALRAGRSTKQVYRWCKRWGIDPHAFRR